MATSPHLFLFTGDDTFSLHEKVIFWIEQFTKKYGQGKINTVDGSIQSSTPLVSQLKNHLQSNSLFATTSLVIIKNILKSKQSAEVKEYLKTYLPKTSEKTFLVLQEDSIEKKDSLYKTFSELEKEGKAKIDHFTSPDGEQLKKWLISRAGKHNLTLNSQQASYIANRLDPPVQSWPPQKKKIDLWKANNYIIKISAYAQSKPLTKDVIDEFISDESSTTAFDVIDALFSRDTSRTLNLLHKSFDEGSPSIKSDLLGLVTLLNRQIREFITIKEMESRECSEADIAENLGWQTKRLWVVRKKITTWTHTELITLAADMMDMEQSIKFTSGNPLILLEQYIFKKT